jgi:uncharacterized protein involved in exopolysaccharide biosynthesis
MSRRTPMTFRIIDAFFRHVWLFVAAVVVVSGLSMTALYLRTKTFHATALTQVVTEDVASELGETQNTSYVSPAQQNVDRLQDLLNDDLPGGFLDTALKSASLDQPMNLDPAAQDKRLAKLRKSIAVSPQSQTTFSIGLTWDRSGECQRIIESLRQQYIQEVGFEREAQSIATGRFLDSQIHDYEGQMRQAEQVLIKYRSGNSGDLPEAQTAAISQLSSLQAQRDNLRISQHDSDMKRNAILVRIAQIKPMSILEQTSAESPLVTQIKVLQAKRDALLAGNMLPAHPQVVALTEQIDALEKQNRAKIQSGASEAKGAVSTKLQENPEYQALQQQLMDANIAQQTQTAQTKLLDQEIAQYETRVQQIPMAQRELTDKTRNYSILKTQYESLLLRREQAQLKGNLDKVSATSALSPLGSVYAQPTVGSDKQMLMLLGSLVLGIIVGIIAVVFSEWSDRSLRDAGDVERLLGVTVLGLIPETQTVWTPRLPGGRSRGALTAPEG